MNTIAFIAFLVGINTSAPTAPPAATEKKQSVEEQSPKTGKDSGFQKRGGWDHN